MKNISSIFIFFSPLFFAAASYGVDSIAYGDWNAAETWKNGDIPPADSTGSGVLCQNACNDTNFFYFDRDSAAGAINTGWVDGNYIMKSLNEDAVFTLYGTNSSNGVIAMRGGSGGTDAVTQNMTFESGNYNIVAGPGTSDTYARINLGINSNSNPNMKKHLVFGKDTSVTSEINLYFDNMRVDYATNYSDADTARSIIDLNGKFTVDPSKTTYVRGVTLNINEGSSVSFGKLTVSNYAILNLNSAMSMAPTEVAKDASCIEVSANSTLNINSALSLAATGSVHNMTIYGSVNVSSEGSFAMSGGYGTVQIKSGGVLTLNSGEKTFQSNGCLRLDGGRLVLNTTNAYWGNFTSNRSNSLWLMMRNADSEQAMSYLDVNAFNQLGGFCFGNNDLSRVSPALTVTLGEGEGVMLELAYLTTSLDSDKGYLMGDSKLVFVNFRNGAVKVLNKRESTTVNGVVYADDFSLISAEGYEDFRLEKDAEGDFYWLTATQVPEVSTVASVFGIMALGFALIRRRK